MPKKEQLVFKSFEEMRKHFFPKQFRKEQTRAELEQANAEIDKLFEKESQL